MEFSAIIRPKAIPRIRYFLGLEKETLVRGSSDAKGAEDTQSTQRAGSPLATRIKKLPHHSRRFLAEQILIRMADYDPRDCSSVDDEQSHGDSLKKSLELE